MSGSLYRIRGLRKWAAFTCAILNGLVGGTPAVFALYAPSFQRPPLSYTSLQVNLLGVACQLGLYLTVPVIGWVCDTYGPAYIAGFACVSALPAYVLAAEAYTHPQWPTAAVLAGCYAVIGTATVSMYMSALSTVARNHPRSRGLSMALVTASFGSAGLWQVQLADKLFRSPVTGELDLPRLFFALGGMVSVVAFVSTCVLASYKTPGCLACLGSRSSRSRRQSDFIRQHFTRRGIDADSTSSASIAPSTEDANDDDDAADEETALLSRSIELDKATASVRISTFLKDHSSWWYFLAFILLAGPAEVFINNVGTMYYALGPSPLGALTTIVSPSASTQVSLLAAASTFGRLAFGGLCDVPLISRSAIASKMVVLLVAAGCSTVGFVWLATGASSQDRFWPAPVLVGLGNGGIFTAYPVIVSVVWGIDNLATYWGLLAVAPAIGGSAFAIVYAKLYDAAANATSPPTAALCRGVRCFNLAAAYFAASNAIGVALLAGALVVWVRRFRVRHDA
ncbi:Putative monocarboxylate transporter mch1 [Savitreella phatthalungensis]